MNEGYFKCSQCGSVADDGTVKGSKFYCMDCLDSVSTVYSKEQLETMLQATQDTIKTAESYLTNNSASGEVRGLLKSLRDSEQRYIRLLKGKKG